MGLSMAMMRDYVIKAYPNSDNWRLRVLQMPERQVVAIYHNMLNHGKFNKKRIDYGKRRKDVDQVYEQLTIFDFGVEVPR